MKKASFEVMVNTICAIGNLEQDVTEEQEVAWDLECNSAFIFGGWDEQEFWDEYYSRRAQSEIEELIS